MTPEEMKQIVEQVAAAVTARPAAPTPTPPAMPMQPLSAMVMPPAGNMAMPPAVAPIGVTVAITIPLPDGTEASGHIQLDPSALAHLPQVVAGLAGAGWPVRTFQPRQQTNRWGTGGGYGRRSWRS